jgi:cardiolipin synthase
MLRARLWALSHGAPPWTQLQAEWARAETDPTLCETIAGRLSGADMPRLIASGEEGFTLREALYRQAARSVDIATYYLQPDDTGRSTIQALAACAARGVRVRLLLDRVMTSRKAIEVGGMDRLLADARAAGILVTSWQDPDRPYDSNHRKMIVIDERTAVVGGRNFADHYRGEAWRDVDLAIEGPSVAPLVALFEAIWADPIMRGVLSAVGAARRSVDLELAYFVAHDALCGALARAAARDVRVRLLTNSAESTDLPYAAWTAYEGARRVLEAGGSVYVRRGAGRTLHSKYVVVDEEWVSFGSHNLDYYSPRYCCETNLVVRDGRLGRLLTDVFETGVTDATPLSLEEDVRPFLRRSLLPRAFDRGFRDFQ